MEGRGREFRAEENEDVTDAAPQCVLQTDTLRATVLPALGGKIASLRWLPGDVELLQAPLAPYADRTPTMGFEESDASGIDECLPSVAACEVRTAGGMVGVPDHGDFWRLPWEWKQWGNEIQMANAGAGGIRRLADTHSHCIHTLVVRTQG